MTTVICVCALIIMSFLLFIMIRIYLKMKKQYTELKDLYDKYAKYKEATDEKINDLHTGDTITNALNVLSEHK